MKKHPFTDATIEQTYDHEHPWRTYFSLFRGDRRRLVLALIMYVIKAAPVWTLPIYIGFVVDQVVSAAAPGGVFSWEPLVWPSVGMIVLNLQNIVTHTLFARLLSVALRNMEASIRMAQVRRLQQLSLHFHSHHSAGTLQNKILRDVENLTNLTNNLVNSVFPAVVTITIAIALTLAKAPVLTLLFVVLAPLALLLQRAFSRPLKKNNTAFRKNLEAMNSRVLEMIEMAPVTRAHGLEEVEVEKMGRQFAEVQKQGLRLDLTVAWFGASAWVTFMTAQVLALLVMASLAGARVITAGDVLLFQSYFTSLIGALNALLNLLPDLAKGRDSIASMAEILECPDLEQNKNKTVLVKVQGGFVAEDLRFQYPGVEVSALDRVRFAVNPGETIAVVGESGSGKSTLMQLLIGFYRPTQGRLLLDGQDMAELDLRTYRRFLSVVPQQTLLFHGTVRDNLTYGLSGISDVQLWQVLERAWAAEFVGQLPEGLGADLGVHGGTLSGGQRQRLAIARALLRDPRVLILDEATSALDLQSEREVQKAIGEASRGRTTFLVAHRLSTIRDAHRVFVMKNGQIVESGSQATLLTREGEFSRLARLNV